MPADMVDDLLEEDKKDDGMAINGVSLKRMTSIAQVQNLIEF